jgi:hypothetical protein
MSVQYRSILGSRRLPLDQVKVDGDRGLAEELLAYEV